MNAVFADTFVFLAILNPRDQAHERSVQVLGAYDGPIITSEWVLMEVGDALSAVRERTKFTDLLDKLRSIADVKILPADSETFQEACTLFAARPDKNWSLTDCTSFAIMSRLSVTAALTADHHFRQAGFVALLD